MRRRRALLVAISVVCTTTVVTCLSILGISYVNLDNLLRSPVQFFLLLVLPATVGTATLLAAILPRVVTVNLALTICGIGLLDTGARFLTPKPASVEGHLQVLTNSQFYAPDSALGYILAPNAVARHRGTDGATPVYDVVYRTDAHGRRDTPVTPRADRTSFVIWFGDSNVFGEGLSQTETLPYYTGEVAPKYRPYNYGVPGYGPSNVLALVRRGVLGREVIEREGYALVFLIPAHVGRVIGGSIVSTSWGRHFPYYTEGPGGELEHRGDFVHGRPFVTLGYFLWTKSGFAQCLGLDLPTHYTAADYRLTAKVLKESHRLLAQQLNLRGFVVILSQVYDDTQRRIMEGMREALAHEEILYLDYTRLYDGSNPEYRLAEHDYHNSSTANQLIAARLASDLLHDR